MGFLERSREVSFSEPFVSSHDWKVVILLLMISRFRRFGSCCNTERTFAGVWILFLEMSKNVKLVKDSKQLDATRLILFPWILSSVRFLKPSKSLSSSLPSLLLFRFNFLREIRSAKAPVSICAILLFFRSNWVRSCRFLKSDACILEILFADKSNPCTVEGISRGTALSFGSFPVHMAIWKLIRQLLRANPVTGATKLVIFSRKIKPKVKDFDHPLGVLLSSFAPGPIFKNVHPTNKESRFLQKIILKIQ